MTYRIRNIGIAVALAIVAALLTTFYVTNYKRTVQQGEQKVPVYVAAGDIALGTPGADVANGKLLRIEHVTRRSVVPGAISKPDQIDNLVAVEPIYAGEQISTRRFRTAEEQGIRAQLKGNLRALQVPGTNSQLMGGTLQVGDRIDIVGNWLMPEEGQTHVSRVVLRNLLVLQAPSTETVGGKIGANPNEPFFALVAMTDSQAEKFWWIQQNGDWTFQLRPVSNATDSPDRLETARTVAVDGLTGSARRRAGGR